jgi:hypothetical protein
MDVKLRLRALVLLTRRRELRNAQRKRTRSAAWISFGASPTPIPCVLWDMSEEGVRLTAAHTEILPDRFTLHLAKDKPGRLCRVAWRKKPYLGVRFVS